MRLGCLQGTGAGWDEQDGSAAGSGSGSPAPWPAQPACTPRPEQTPPCSRVVRIRAVAGRDAFCSASGPTSGRVQVPLAARRLFEARVIAITVCAGSVPGPLAEIGETGLIRGDTNACPSTVGKPRGRLRDEAGSLSAPALNHPGNTWKSIAKISKAEPPFPTIPRPRPLAEVKIKNPNPAFLPPAPRHHPISPPLFLLARSALGSAAWHRQPGTAGQSPTAPGLKPNIRVLPKRRGAGRAEESPQRNKALAGGRGAAKRAPTAALEAVKNWQILPRVYFCAVSQPVSGRK